jgi:hypothetical protein
MAARRRSGDWAAPIGVLTHHRNLDPPAWAFFEAFLGEIGRRRARIDWRSPRELIDTLD